MDVQMKARIKRVRAQKAKLEERAAIIDEKIAQKQKELDEMELALVREQLAQYNMFIEDALIVATPEQIEAAQNCENAAEEVPTESAEGKTVDIEQTANETPQEDGYDDDEDDDETVTV